jgi:hypothetical protein
MGLGEAGSPVVNGDQPDRLPNVVRVLANLGFLLPALPARKGPAGNRLAKWQNDRSAWVHGEIERLGLSLA